MEVARTDATVEEKVENEKYPSKSLFSLKQTRRKWLGLWNSGGRSQEWLWAVFAGVVGGAGGRYLRAKDTERVIPMPVSKKAEANKRNAQASTGPKTARGKAIASTNATRHGILSQELMLPHEAPAEFDDLLSALITELGAAGTLECALVERIAVAIWRQRRLVRAERQDIQKQNDSAAAEGGDDTRGLRLSDVLKLNDAGAARHTLSGEPYASNLEALEREVRRLPASAHMSFAQYSEAFPWFSKLYPAPTEAEAKGAFASTSLSQMYGTAESLQAVWLPAVLDVRQAGASLLSERARRRAVSTPSNTESLARYQAALDNEWYKAMRAFREARHHRLRTLDSVQE